MIVAVNVAFVVCLAASAVSLPTVHDIESIDVVTSIIIIMDDRSSDTRLAEALNNARTLDLNGQDRENLELMLDEFFGEDIEESEDEEDEEEDDGTEEPLNMSISSSDEDANNDTIDNAEADSDEGEEELAININLAEDVMNQHVEDNPDFRSDNDEKEMTLIRRKKCRCKNRAMGLGCSHKFPDEEVFRMRYQMQALSPESKCMFLMGKISTGGVDAARPAGACSLG